MLRKIYLSPLGYLISTILQLVGRLHRPFMIYGYWNSPTHSFRKLTRVSSTAVFIDKNKIDFQIFDYFFSKNYVFVSFKIIFFYTYLDGFVLRLN